MTFCSREANAVLDRLKERCGFKSDRVLAAALGCGPTILSSWRHRNSVPYERLIDFAISNRLDLNWLFLGATSTDPAATVRGLLNEAAELQDGLLRIQKDLRRIEEETRLAVFSAGVAG